MANILYVGFYSLPDKDAAANRVVNNAKALRDAGHRVWFLDEQQDCVNNIIETKHDGLGFQSWSALRPNGFKGLLKKMTSIKNITTVVEEIKNLDVIIVYNYPSIALIKLTKYCRKHNIKIAADCTEWYSGKDYNFPMNVLSAGDSFLRMRLAQKKLDGIIAISSYLRNYYNKCKNVVFVPPLVDTDDSKWNQEKYSFDMHKLNLVYAGNLGKSKEVFLPIIDALNTSYNRQEIVLRIVGATKEQFLKMCPDAKEKIKGLENSVVFYGRVSHKESLKIVSSSDYLVFLREKNRVTMAGFSTKFVEALSCGTAVITTDTSDMKSYIQRLSCGYLIDEKITLTEIFNKDINELKEVKRNIKGTDLFDYKGYIPMFTNWIKQLLNL